MVTHSRTPARPDQLRPLNQPRPIVVLTRSGLDGEPEPIALIARRRRYRIARIEDQWRVEDEWWRDRPISRRYYRLALAAGIVRIVYHDRVEDAWYAHT